MCVGVVVANGNSDCSGPVVIVVRSVGGSVSYVVRPLRSTTGVHASAAGPVVVSASVGCWLSLVSSWTVATASSVASAACIPGNFPGCEVGLVSSSVTSLVKTSEMYMCCDVCAASIVIRPVVSVGPSPD